MKIPPRWVFEIWNEAGKHCATEMLRTLPKDCDGLQNLRKQVVTQFGQAYEPERLIALAWALYAFDREHRSGGALNEETKYAFASFLKAGGGHLMKAAGLLDGTIRAPYNPRDDEWKAAEAVAKAFGRNAAQKIGSPETHG